VWTHSWEKALSSLSVNLKFALHNPQFTAHFLHESRTLEKIKTRYLKTGAIALSKIRKLGLKLTTACNLRCPMCYQWRPRGLHSAIGASHLNFSRCDKLFDFSRKFSADVVLSGGEPMLSPYFLDFVDEFCGHGSYCYICTNGTLIENYIGDLEAYSKRLGFLVSLDGPESIHDEIRGKGNFRKTVSGLSHLVAGKRKNKSKWLVGVEVTMLQSNVDDLHEIIKICERIGIDWMVFNHLWIISEKARKEYQEFCTTFNTPRPISLQGFDTPIDDEVFLNKVIAFCLSVKDRKNRIPVFLKPDLSPEGIRSYWRGQIQRPGKYLKLALKMDIEANGDVSPFKNFPDVSLGNIYESPIAEILTSDRYRQVFEYLLTNNLYIYHSCPDYYNLGLTQK